MAPSNLPIFARMLALFVKAASLSGYLVNTPETEKYSDFMPPPLILLDIGRFNRNFTAIPRKLVLPPIRPIRQIPCIPGIKMKAADVDWEVHEVPSYATYNDQTIPSGQKVLIRGDTGAILSNVGEDWHIVQNKDAFNFFTEYVLAGDMDMNTAGSLKGGQIVWALTKVKESFDNFGGDKVDAYLLFSNPHQYGKCIDVRFTPIRVVCNNTLTLSLSTASKRAARVSHASVFDAELVKGTLGIAHEKFAEYKEMAEFLGSKRYSIDLLKQYYKEVFPHTTVKKGVENVGEMGREDITTNNAKRCMELVESQPGGEYAEGTWWQAFNSVTYFTDHVQGRNAENRLHSQWYGKNQPLKSKALDKALKYAKVF